MYFIFFQDVDISGNRIGPQGFRAIMVSLCHNNTIHSLNVANNGADTDSAVGHLFQIIYTYTVSRVTYTDEYRACIWTSLGEFRYERYESVYVTLLTV